MIRHVRSADSPEEDGIMVLQDFDVIGGNIAARLLVSI
jgi:hypothetical protein